MSSVAYLLDENVDPTLGRELLRREPGMLVLRVGDPSAPPAGTLDPDILVWCDAHGFVLVTNNLLAQGHERSEARAIVERDIDRVLDRWQGQPEA